MTHFIDFRGVELEIRGNYYPQTWGDRETPPEKEKFDIDLVMLNGENVTELLEELMEDIEQTVLETHYQ